MVWWSYSSLDQLAHSQKTLQSTWFLVICSRVSGQSGPSDLCQMSCFAILKALSILVVTVSRLMSKCSTAYAGTLFIMLILDCAGVWIFNTCSLLVNPFSFSWADCFSAASTLLSISTALVKVKFASSNNRFCVFSWRIPHTRRSRRACSRYCSNSQWVARRQVLLKFAVGRQTS